MTKKDEIISKLLDEVYEEFPNESYSDCDIAQHVYDYCQPKWIKIESESDLPKEKGDYWIANENGVFDFIASIDQIKAKFENNTCTHYMRFFKPQPPQED